MTTLAIIPARGGSKGVPRKNLREVGGRSLIERAVLAAVASGVADHVLVTTDDQEIADVAIACGAEVPFLRPEGLADDKAAAIPVVEHALDAFEAMSGRTVKTLIFTEPTLPFRTAEHIRDAYSRFQEGGCRSVIAVCPLERKPENIFLKREDRTLERLIKDEGIRFSRRQDMGHLCRLSSGVYIVEREAFRLRRDLVIEPVGFVEMSEMESVNIDTEVDLMLAEAIAGRYGI